MPKNVTYKDANQHIFFQIVQREFLKQCQTNQHTMLTFKIFIIQKFNHSRHIPAI